MRYPTFEETNLSAIAFNRINRYWSKKTLISKFENGKYTGKWQQFSYADFADSLEKLCGAWIEFGLEPGDRVAIFGKNRPRWMHTSLSLLACGLVIVPVYPTLTAKDAGYILKDSGAKYVVTDTGEQAEKILAVKDNLPELRGIYVMEEVAASPDDGIGNFEDLLRVSKENTYSDEVIRRIRAITGDNLAAIIYTSGTTGRPKGVMLTHGNFLSQRSVLKTFDLNDNDIFLNHLPFCHSFGFTTDLLGATDVGAALAIADGLKPEQIRDGLTSIRPTVLMSVPRLFEKLYIEVQRVVSQKPRPIQKLFRDALSVGKQVFDLRNAGKPLPLDLQLKYKLASRIINKVRKQAGLDRCRVAFAGGGPTSRELCYFFQSLGIDIYQGYGLTETSPICNVNIPGKNKLGTVGPPIPGVEVRIDEGGEILLRGPNIMKGYYNDPDSTAEAIDKEGWFHTGDIGNIDADGYLTITDRKKEIIVTSGGKNIAPQGIEAAYNTEPYIERIVVVGDDRKYLTALVCPNFELLEKWAQQNNLIWNTRAELITLPEIIKLVEGRVNEINRHFARFEQLKKVALVDHEFTEETGELTPTQKVKRRVVDSMYKKVIDSMYPQEERI